MARRSSASWRLRACDRDPRRWPARRAHPLEQAGPLAGPSVVRGLDVELHLHPAQRPVGVLATRAARRGGPPGDLRQREVEPLGARAASRSRPPDERTSTRVRSRAMDYRHLGRSGMLVSALSYGNWITHGSQIEEDAAAACVKAALDAGITTFDTADVYAIGAAESVLGRALKGVRRDSIEIFTKVYWPTGPNPNNRGLSRKHIMESLHSSLERLQTDHVDLLQAHRYDYAAPLEETLRAFDDLVRQGKVHYIGVSEWTAEQIADALRLADEMGFDRIISNQPQYSLIWRVIEAEVVPLCAEGGRRPDRVVAAGPGRADREVPARASPARRTARGPPAPRAGR